MTETPQTITVEIKNRWTGAVIFTAAISVSIDERRRLRAAVEMAVAASASLDDASLDDASLDYASLDGASMNGASMNRASLDGASMNGASMNGASLNGASLNGVTGLPQPEPEEAAARIRAVAQAALASDGALEMSDWHHCDTSHCIAGWAVHLSGYAGYALEKVVGAPMAGLVLLGVEAHSHFYDDNETARAWLQSKLEPAS